VQLGLLKGGAHLSTPSTGLDLLSSTSRAAAATALHAWRSAASKLFVVSLTQTTRARRRTFVAMPRPAGATTLLEQLTERDHQATHGGVSCRAIRASTRETLVHSSRSKARVKSVILTASTLRRRLGAYLWVPPTVVSADLSRSALLVRWIAAHNRPFAIVDDPEFRALMKTGRPGYELPTGRTVQRDTTAIFQAAAARVGTMLKVSVLASIQTHKLTHRKEHGVEPPCHHRLLDLAEPQGIHGYSGPL